MQLNAMGGPSIVFRPPTDADFAALADMRRDRHMQSMLMAIPERTDDEAIKNWIERRVSEPDGMFQVIAQEGQGEVLGFIQISQVNTQHSYGYGAIAVSNSCEIPGVAFLAMRELLRNARSDLGLKKLMAEIRVDNTLAIRMNTLCGYKIIGTLEQHFVDHSDGRHDVVLLQKMLG